MIKEMMTKTAIVVLCYADYESLEISLAALMKNTHPEVKIFILQNGRGTYDTERTYRVALRYKKLFPQQIEVVDWIKPQIPYYSIRELLNSEVMEQYQYICKIDDDVFPITENWIEELMKCYQAASAEYGSEFAYATTLVNNNPWGFSEVVDIMDLKQKYVDKYSRNHYVGIKDNDIYPQRFIPKGEIGRGCDGTVWGMPYLSRWIHHETTLKPELYIEKTRGLPCKEVSNQERYSINCMLFKKEFWNDIKRDSDDDEHCTFLYCKENNKKIIAAMNVPMVHLFFFIQREENKDLIPEIRACYEQWLDLPYPISICPIKAYENENRLRYLETRMREVELSTFGVRIKYMRYKLLSKLLFGRARRKYREKARSLSVKGR